VNGSAGRVRLALAVVFGAGASEAALAHHSYAQYDRCTSFTVEGDIERVTWTNPHTLLTLKTQDGAFLIEWFPLPQLARAGIEKGVLKVGDHVVFDGSRNRTPGLRVLSLVSAVRRPADGWQWSRESAVGPNAHCMKFRQDIASTIAAPSRSIGRFFTAFRRGMRAGVGAAACAEPRESARQADSRNGTDPRPDCGHTKRRSL
jgi:Family of unknown function (DUF6152)